MGVSEKVVVKYDKNKKATEYGEDIYFEGLGTLTFCLTEAGLNCAQRTVADEVPSYYGNSEHKESFTQFLLEQHHQKRVYHMMAGIDFLSCVASGGFNDYDGSLCDVYVDGYRSNLGLWHEGICQGDFLVDGEVFKELCEAHHILVNWANK